MRRHQSTGQGGALASVRTHGGGGCAHLPCSKALAFQQVHPAAQLLRGGVGPAAGSTPRLPLGRLLLLVLVVCGAPWSRGTSPTMWARSPGGVQQVPRPPRGALSLARRRYLLIQVDVLELAEFLTLPWIRGLYIRLFFFPLGLTSQM